MEQIHLNKHMVSVIFCNAAPGGSSDASAPQASHSQAADEEEEEEGDAAKSKQAKKEQQGGSRKGDEYWDEEDELEEYVMRRDLGQIKDCDADDSASGSDGMICNLYQTFQIAYTPTSVKRWNIWIKQGFTASKPNTMLP